MISVLLHTKGAVVHGPVPLARISDVTAAPDALPWVDVVDPTIEELALLREEFALPPLALEDVAKEDQRPKIEHYDEAVFLVFCRLKRSSSRLTVGAARG